MLSEDRGLGVTWTVSGQPGLEVDPSVSLAQPFLLTGRREWGPGGFPSKSFLASLMEHFAPLSNISLNFE